MMNEQPTTTKPRKGRPLLADDPHYDHAWQQRMAATRQQLQARTQPLAVGGWPTLLAGGGVAVGVVLVLLRWDFWLANAAALFGVGFALAAARYYRRAKQQRATLLLAMIALLLNGLAGWLALLVVGAAFVGLLILTDG